MGWRPRLRSRSPRRSWPASSAPFAVAVVASRWFPFGVAGEAEPHPGLDVDWLVLGFGGLACVVLLASVVGLASWRTAHVDPDATSMPLRPGATTRALESVARRHAHRRCRRYAFKPGRGRTAVPVRSTLLARASVARHRRSHHVQCEPHHVVDTPTAQGRAWDATVYDQRTRRSNHEDMCSRRRPASSTTAPSTGSRACYAALELDGTRSAPSPCSPCRAGSSRRCSKADDRAPPGRSPSGRRQYARSASISAET